jgi:hypothetical protein
MPGLATAAGQVDRKHHGREKDQFSHSAPPFKETLFSREIAVDDVMSKCFQTGCPFDGYVE